MHIPAKDSEFKTYLYTVYERARLDYLDDLDDLEDYGDVSYYVLVKNTINAGIEISNLDTDDFSANNLFLPTNEEGKGSIFAKTLAVSYIEADGNIDAHNIFLPTNEEDKGLISAKTLAVEDISVKSNIITHRVEAVNIISESIQAGRISLSWTVNPLVAGNKGDTLISKTGWYYIFLKEEDKKFYSVGLVFWTKGHEIHCPINTTYYSKSPMECGITKDGKVYCKYYPGGDYNNGADFDSKNIYWCKISSIC
jgi:hypothetical protein